MTEAKLPKGVVLFEKDKPYSKIYFPTSSVISTIALFEDGQIAEMGTTGCEGLVPIGAVVRSPVALNRRCVQIEGLAFAISYPVFRRVQKQSPGFENATLCCAQAYIAQVQQSVACNSIHNNEERAARWLLMCCDRAESSTFPLTQELLAAFLGVTRPTVSLIWRTFQNVGVISYRRGFVTIEDRQGLEELACECYQITRNAYHGCFSRAKTQKVPYC
ncbi:MAG: Crp/Fnr family transcriptional regulator [Rhodomicrobium sp.]